MRERGTWLDFLFGRPYPHPYFDESSDAYVLKGPGSQEALGTNFKRRPPEKAPDLGHEPRSPRHSSNAEHTIVRQSRGLGGARLEVTRANGATYQASKPPWPRQTTSQPETR